MQLHPYMITIVWRLTNPESGAKVCFCTWLLGLVHEEIGKLAFFLKLFPDPSITQHYHRYNR